MSKFSRLFYLSVFFSVALSSAAAVGDEASDEAVGDESSDERQCKFDAVEERRTFRLHRLERRHKQLWVDDDDLSVGLGAVYSPEQLPENLIEEIEVYKAGGSSLFGGSPMGSVVNALVGRPKRNFGTINARTDWITFKTPSMRLNADAGIVNADGNFALHVYGGAISREAWEDPKQKDGLSEIDRLRNATAGSKFFYDLPYGMSVEGNFRALYSSSRGGEISDKPEHETSLAESERKRHYAGSLRWLHEVNEHLSYEAGYSLSYMERKAYYGGGKARFPELSAAPEKPAEPDNRNDAAAMANYEAELKKYEEKLKKYNEAKVRDDANMGEMTMSEWNERMRTPGGYGKSKNWLHVADASLSINFNALGDQVVTLTGEFSHETMKDDFLSYDRKIDVEEHGVLMSMRHEWAFAPWGNLLWTLQMDKTHEMSEPIFSPNAALYFSPLSWLSAKTGFTSDFTTPDFLEQDLRLPMVGGFPAIVRRSEELEYERYYSLVQELNGHIDFEDWELKATFNAFWTRINDPFTVIDDPESRRGERSKLRVNNGKADLFGGELDLSVNYDNMIGMDVSWVYRKGKNDTEHPDYVGQKGSKNLFRFAETYGNVGLWFDYRNFAVTTCVDITGPYYVPHQVKKQLFKTPWFVDWDINASYTIDMRSDRYLKIYAGMENVLDSRQKGEKLDFGPRRDSTFIYGPEKPRTLFVGLRLGI